MLFQVEKIEDLAKNIVDLPVVWIWGVQKFPDFFYVNDVSLNVRIKTGLKKEKQSYHTMGWQSTHCQKGTILWHAESMQNSIQHHKIPHIVE